MLKILKPADITVNSALQEAFSELIFLLLYLHKYKFVDELRGRLTPC